MKGDSVDSAMGTQQQEPGSSSASLSMSDILALPDEQRRIANWLMRRKGSTLSDVAQHLGEDEATAKSTLDNLVEQGIVQQAAVEGESRYSVKLGAKRTGHLSDKLYQTLTPDKPITSSISPSGDVSVPVGSTFELRVTVVNHGNQSALINIYIDQVSGILREWCISPSEHLALEPEHSSEVVFQIQIPVEAQLGSYDYKLVVDGSAQYPEDSPILHQARLQLIALD